MSLTELYANLQSAWFFLSCQAMRERDEKAFVEKLVTTKLHPEADLIIHVARDRMLKGEEYEKDLELYLSYYPMFFKHSAEEMTEEELKRGILEAEKKILPYLE